jgi:hypothetical protein
VSITLGLELQGKNLRMSESRVLKRIFEPKREEVTKVGENRTEELQNLHFSQNIIRLIN